MAVVEILGRLNAALGDLTTVDLDELSDNDLDDATVALARVGHRVEAATARFAARWDSQVIWMNDGSRSPAARLARDGNCSRRHARSVLRRGRRLGAMPATAQAWSDGEISADHVDLLASCAARRRGELFERDEKLLVDDAKELRFDELAKVVAYWKQHADAEVGDDGDPPGCDPSLDVGPGADGEVRINGHLDPVGGAEFQEALQRIFDELARADRAGGVVRTVGRRRADALVEMARRATNAPAGSRQPRPLITIVVGADSLRHLCELANGTVIHPVHLLPHLAHCDVETIIFDGPHQPVSKSPRRSFTGALRRAVEARDRHCQHPSGCDEPITRCDVDHVTPWCEGGETTLDNGRLACHYHNRIQPQGTKPPAPPPPPPPEPLPPDPPPPGPAPPPT